ncbi:hypothetical protein [Aquicella lusitana]|uniref:Uncharacterized protein n=1 Tax=Aquicella lusitana TaxID=254246 RepID=A0A370G8F1_9COXI|nr:hypothetical protein [Aquicella lusitana]RDI40061.1 hypothetical protein C8D86_12411 [Aquicella lusitana]VVC72341.1 hypothetical protein AQULUS_00510 [Aquicella lusitana]
MNQLMKWTFLFGIVMIMVDSGHAWNIGAKGRAIGPVIHTTYFLTPNNGAFPVRATAYVGTFLNGTCQYSAIYNIGSDLLQTGNFVDIDAFQLKSVVGGGYSCMTIYYSYRQQVIETFQLVWDGINYINSNPATAEVTIL